MVGSVQSRMPDPKIALVDEFGELDRQIQLFKPTIERHDKIKSIIKSWYSDAAPDTTDVVRGNVYEIQVGARERERTWREMSAVSKAVGGPKAFLEIASVAIKSVENLIGKAKTDELLVESPTGARRIKSVLRSASTPEA